MHGGVSVLRYDIALAHDKRGWLAAVTYCTEPHAGALQH